MKSIFILAVIVIICNSCSKTWIDPSPPIKVYPNPFKEKLNVSISTSENWSLTFLDGKGKSVKDTSGNSNFSSSFDFSSYKDESILVELTIDSKVYVIQVLKEASK